MTRPDWHTLAQQTARERVDNELIVVEGTLWTRKTYYDACIESGDAPHMAHFMAYGDYYDRATAEEQATLPLWNAAKETARNTAQERNATVQTQNGEWW